jgi:hypothetical protein
MTNSAIWMRKMTSATITVSAPTDSPAKSNQSYLWSISRHDLIRRASIRTGTFHTYVDNSELVNPFPNEQVAGHDCATGHNRYPKCFVQAPFPLDRFRKLWKPKTHGLNLNAFGWIRSVFCPRNEATHSRKVPRYPTIKSQ